MTSKRITNDEALDTIVTRIKNVIQPEQVEAFLDVRMTAYNRTKKVDAFITLKEGRIYLPYPYNIKLVAKLYAEFVNDETVDEFDI